MNVAYRWFAVLAIAVATCASGQDAGTAVAIKELSPTGKLRVGVVVASVPSPLFAVKDKDSGRLRGVTVDLGTELAQKLGVPVELVTYDTPTALTDSATSGAWDVTFLPVTPERQKVVDFGPAYFFFENTYVVAADSPIRSLTDIDRPGVRVVAQEKSTQAAFLGQSLKNATLLIRPGSGEELSGMVHSGKADAFAFGRPFLVGLAAKQPRARVLDGSFASFGVAVAVPKSRPHALEYVSGFLEKAKASGSVQRAFDNVGLKGLSVAPPSPRQ